MQLDPLLRSAISTTKITDASSSEEDAMTPTPPVLRIGTITIIGAAEIAAWRAKMQALFGERK